MKPFLFYTGKQQNAILTGLPLYSKAMRVPNKGLPKMIKQIKLQVNKFQSSTLTALKLQEQ